MKRKGIFITYKIFPYLLAKYVLAFLILAITQLVFYFVNASLFSIASVKDAMMICPVIVCCFEGVGAIEAVRMITGPTTGRKAPAGTIRGDYSMSFQENIVHASDSPETAEAELKRFFKPEEIYEYKQSTFDNLYANDEF